MTKADSVKDIGGIFFAAVSLTNIHIVLNIISVALVILFTVPGIIIRWRRVFAPVKSEKEEEKLDKNEDDS